jgi:hypothetical protein
LALFCHVWTAPAVQEESGAFQRSVGGAAMYSAFSAAALAAGPDVIR